MRYPRGATVPDGERGDVGMTRWALPGGPVEQAHGASAAVRVGRRVFVSGLVGEEAAGGGVVAQFRRAADRAEAALAGLDCSLADAVRTRVFCTRAEDLAALGAAHGERFGAVRPALSLTQVSCLPGALPGAP